MELNRQIQIAEKIQNVLKVEAEALEFVCQSVTPQMTEAVDAIYHCEGRLIVTGVGKSAIIAKKIVATLNSTGSTAIFMHAADAIHGDLGIISQNDIVMCISKSGNTPEIKVLVPLIRGFGNKIIGLVCNDTSYLAINADYVIHLPMENEADPNNLAPTTSTTLQMAMGDAIAVTLLSMRGFSPEHFARYHPGGSLGKQLYLKVRDVISQSYKPVVTEDDDIKKVIIQISEGRLGATAVTTSDGKLKGIITDGDLRRMLETNNDIVNLKATDIMTISPKCVSPNTLAVDALALMRQFSITQLVVEEDNKYMGIIHLHAIIREGII